MLEHFTHTDVISQWVKLSGTRIRSEKNQMYVKTHQVIRLNFLCINLKSVYTCIFGNLFFHKLGLNFKKKSLKKYMYFIFR